MGADPTLNHMIDAFYKSSRLAGRCIKFQCVREVVIGADRAERVGGYVLACSHLSHLEPFVVSALLRKRVRWMARVEFYTNWLAAAALNAGGAFPVDRFGNTMPAVRKAVSLANAGEIVGIFPEGGVAQGENSVLRGGPFKQGACTIAVATRLPIVPVVVLGTHNLNRVGPWLPFRRAKLWVAFGRHVAPRPRSDSRREDRLELAERLGAEFVRTYHALLEHSGLRDSDTP